MSEMKILIMRSFTHVVLKYNILIQDTFYILELYKWFCISQTLMKIVTFSRIILSVNVFNIKDK